jgi:hypothetical protein
MTEEAASNLHNEVERLRTWLTSNRWVDQYDRWWTVDGVVGALQRFLAEVQPSDWSEVNGTDLLYVLEQSSTDYIAELVANTEPMAIAIAKHSLARGGIASDDLAERLGCCIQSRDEAEALLMDFARDTHERTRRIALLSLAKLGSAAVPALAIAAWNTGDEYQRIGALSALKTVGSGLFSDYLSEALRDGREHLTAAARKYATELDDGHPASATDGPDASLME